MLSLKRQKNKRLGGDGRFSQNPKILDVNLIKDEIRVSFNWQKHFLVFLLAIVVTAGLIIEVYFGLDWWAKQEDSKAQVLRDSIEKVNAEIGKIKSQSDEALSFKDKTVEVTKLLDNHIYFSNFFTWLEKNTLSTVSFGGFQGDLTGKYFLSAKAKTYADVSWQTKAFLNDDKTIAVSVGNAGLFISKNKDEEEDKKEKKEQTAEVVFDLSLEVLPDIFKK